VEAFLDLLQTKAKSAPVRFVVDVDNLGAVKNILSLFKEYDVHLNFFVKNQLNAELPEFTEFGVPFDITLVEDGADNDMAAITEAMNMDCFIMSNDKFQTYVRSGLVDSKWLESHRVACLWKKEFNSEGSASRILPAIPMHMLPRKNQK
jgi:hypothetical protein